MKQKNNNIHKLRGHEAKTPRNQVKEILQSFQKTTGERMRKHQNFYSVATIYAKKIKKKFLCMTTSKNTTLCYRYDYIKENRRKIKRKMHSLAAQYNHYLCL